MSESDVKDDLAVSSGVRVAVEGCGHGTLHAIYASIDEACRVKGWDGVDLLIIGGDFQAVRNQYDLNVTAMPAKYRTMADFHEYYSGSRTAPYLTIFIGGNHEASNHLFELYYGGWVAPKIYYLGAANVLRLGPLRIAGLTGIWKGYDYRKPHFERLPYNQEDVNSIYHVRELDVRKLLSLRSQVDIGLSHDWPQGVEYSGDYNWLFGRKPDFGTDSYAGKLGSVAARQCLERLRPPYWFSAHLHTKFVANFQHNENGTGNDPSPTAYGKNSQATSQSGGLREQHSRGAEVLEDRPHVSAWQQFHTTAQQDGAKERVKVLEDRANRPQQSGPGYSIEETFNKIESENGFDRKIMSVTETTVNHAKEDEKPAQIPQLDGCGWSRPHKRQRIEDEQDDPAPALAHNGTYTIPLARDDQLDGAALSNANPVITTNVTNPDAIEIDMSDEDDTVETDISATTQALPIPGAAKSSNGLYATKDMPKSVSDESEDGGVKLNPQALSFISPTAAISTAPQVADEATTGVSRKASDSTLNPIARDFQPKSDTEHESPAVSKSGEVVTKPDQDGDEVSEEMRARLASLSSNFAPKERIEPTAELPFPEDITNKTTNFLALGKVEKYQEFLQLLEINSFTSLSEEITRPLKLSYDPEWLAIQRVFASELVLGGAPTDKSSPDRGETYYRARIDEEQSWIEENIVTKGKISVPKNFSITAPAYDPAAHVGPGEQPREVTNPQTSAYCELIGIENKFDISEEERNFRMEQGPRPESERFRDYQDQKRNRGGGHGRGGGRGGRGGGRGGRGRGRGRGR